MKKAVVSIATSAFLALGMAPAATAGEIGSKNPTLQTSAEWPIIGSSNAPVAFMDAFNANPGVLGFFDGLGAGSTSIGVGLFYSFYDFINVVGGIVAGIVGGIVG